MLSRNCSRYSFGFFRIFWNSLGFFRIFSDFFLILPYSCEFLRILPDSLGFFRILSKLFRILSYSLYYAGFSRVVSNSLGLPRIFSYSLVLFLILSDSLLFYLILLDFLVFFGFFWILPDSLKFSRILWNTHQIFPDSPVFRIFPDSLDFSRIVSYSLGIVTRSLILFWILSDFQRFSPILSNPPRLVSGSPPFFRIFPDLLGLPRIFYILSEWFRILTYSFVFFRILWDSLEFLWFCTDFALFSRICRILLIFAEFYEFLLGSFESSQIFSWFSHIISNFSGFSVALSNFFRILSELLPISSSSEFFGFLPKPFGFSQIFPYFLVFFWFFWNSDSDCIPNFPEFFWSISDFFMFSRNRSRNSFGFFRIFWDSRGLFQIFPDFLLIVPHSFDFLRILPDSLGFFRILLELFRIFSYSFVFFLILPNSLGFFPNFSRFS